MAEEDKKKPENQASEAENTKTAPEPVEDKKPEENKPAQAEDKADQPADDISDTKKPDDKKDASKDEATEAEKKPAEPTEEEKKIAEEEALAKKQAEEEALAAEEIRVPDLRPGMTVRVHQKIQEGEKERIQVFQGIIIALRGKTPVTKTVTVQKNSFGVMVEKIFPINSPIIEKIEVVKIAKVRRSKLYYLRHYTKRLKETLVKN